MTFFSSKVLAPNISVLIVLTQCLDRETHPKWNGFLYHHLCCCPNYPDPFYSFILKAIFSFVLSDSALPPIVLLPSFLIAFLSPTWSSFSSSLQCTVFKAVCSSLSLSVSARRCFQPAAACVCLLLWTVLLCFHQFLFILQCWFSTTSKACSLFQVKTQLNVSSSSPLVTSPLKALRLFFVINPVANVDLTWGKDQFKKKNKTKKRHRIWFYLLFNLISLKYSVRRNFKAAINHTRDGSTNSSAGETPVSPIMLQMGAQL